MSIMPTLEQRLRHRISQLQKDNAELEDKLKIASSALRRVDNIAYEIDNKMINNIACTALEQIGEFR